MLRKVKLIPIWIKSKFQKLMNAVWRSLTFVVDFFNCVFLLSRKSTEEHLPYADAIKLMSELWPDKGSYPSEIINKDYDGKTALSIIVPAYNVEKYIDECLESILNQKTDITYEVLIIDDGSTDNTLSLLEKYKSDSRVKIIAQNNCGQSVARNKALSLAVGLYVMFVDADDFLLEGVTDTLVKLATDHDADVVEGNICKFYNKEFVTDKDDTNKITVTSYKENPYYFLQSVGYSPGKIYKRELWYNVRFPENYIFEDIINKFILRRMAKKYVKIEKTVYGYRSNIGSTTRGKSSNKKLDVIWVLNKVSEIHKSLNLPEDDIYYFLLLNHIGILNRIIINSFDDDIKKIDLAIISEQLKEASDCKPKKMPLMFRMLDRSIREQKLEAWEKIVQTIRKYNLLKKWREVN